MPNIRVETLYGACINQSPYSLVVVRSQVLDHYSTRQDVGDDVFLRNGQASQSYYESDTVFLHMHGSHSSTNSCSGCALVQAGKRSFRVFMVSLLTTL